MTEPRRIGDTPQGGPVQSFYVRKGMERRPAIARPVTSTVSMLVNPVDTVEGSPDGRLCRGQRGKERRFRQLGLYAAYAGAVTEEFRR